MRKSTKYITLSLLAVSIASCRREPAHRYPIYNSGPGQDGVYMDYGYGYTPILYRYPIGYYPSYGYYGGHISNNTAVVYRTPSGYKATSGGRVSRADVSGSGRVSISRDGFGSSGHSSIGG